MKFRPKFFWKWSFFDQNQQPLKGVEPFERILRALFISQCPYKFSSFLHLRNASNRFRLFLRDFWLFRFFFPGSACFSSLTSVRNLPSWVKYHGNFESFGKEFRCTKFIAVERVVRNLRRTLLRLMRLFLRKNLVSPLSSHGRFFQYRIVVLLQLLAPNDTRLIPWWLSLTLPQNLPAKRTSPSSLVVCEDVHTYI